MACDRAVPITVPEVQVDSFEVFRLYDDGPTDCDQPMVAIAIRGTDHQALPFSDDKRSFPIPDAQPVKSGFGLDPQGQRWLAGLLRSRAERGCAVLLSSHDLHEVSRLADRVVMVARGRVLADEPSTAASSAELEEQYFTLTSGADRAA